MYMGTADHRYKSYITSQQIRTFLKLVLNYVHRKHNNRNVSNSTKFGIYKYDPPDALRDKQKESTPLGQLWCFVYLFVWV